MNPHTDELPQGEITQTTNASGVTLAWPAYKAGHERRILKWVFLLWAVGWLGSVREIATGSKNPLMYVWFAIWTVGGIAALIGLWRQVRRPTPEFVRLEADALRYEPGRGPSDLRSCAELPSGKTVPVKPAPAFELPKSAVRGFGVDRVNDRQRLYVDTDTARTEIGGCLTESERAWLFAVLQAWLGAAEPKPWQRKEVRA